MHFSPIFLVGLSHFVPSALGSCLHNTPLMPRQTTPNGVAVAQFGYNGLQGPAHWHKLNPNNSKARLLPPFPRSSQLAYTPPVCDRRLPISHRRRPGQAHLPSRRRRPPAQLPTHQVSHIRESWLDRRSARDEWEPRVQQHELLPQAVPLPHPKRTPNRRGGLPARDASRACVARQRHRGHRASV